MSVSTRASCGAISLRIYLGAYIATVQPATEAKPNRRSRPRSPPDPSPRAEPGRPRLSGPAPIVRDERPLASPRGRRSCHARAARLLPSLSSERGQGQASDARIGRAASVSRRRRLAPASVARRQRGEADHSRLLPRVGGALRKVACRRIAGHGGKRELLPPPLQRAQSRRDSTRAPRAFLGRPTRAPPAPKSPLDAVQVRALGARPWRVHSSARSRTCVLRDAPRDRLRLQAFRAHRGSNVSQPHAPGPSMEGRGRRFESGRGLPSGAGRSRCLRIQGER